jgi:hypothetical protein
LLSVGLLALPRTAAAQQNLEIDTTTDVSDLCDFGFSCEVDSVTIIYDTSAPTHLDVLSETDVNLDALEDAFGAFNCGTILVNDNELDSACASDDGTGSAAVGGSEEITATTTALFTLVNDSYFADMLDPTACVDGDPTSCTLVNEDGIDIVIGPIGINSVSPLLIAVGTSGTLTITGENLVNPFGGPQPDVHASFRGGPGSGFTVSSPNFSPDGSGGTVSYQAAQNATVGNWNIGISYTMGDTIVVSTNEGSLTVGYPAATVTNVTPNPWLAGQSNFQVTINGQNFGPNPTLHIIGTGVSLLNFTPNANGQSIVATVSVDLNTNTPAALVDVTPGYNGPFVCACTGSPDGTFSVPVQAAIAPPPQIIFNGANVAGTTQSVFAGQQIALTGVPPSGGFLVVNAGWSNHVVSTVGGYGNGSGGPPGPSGGHPLPMPSTTCPTSGNCNLTYYYVAFPATDTLTLTYNLVNGTTSSASVIFNITGPTGALLPNALLQTDNTSVAIKHSVNPPGIVMQMANAPSPGLPGIVINDNAQLPQGNLVWVQIIQSTTYSQIIDPNSGVIPPPNQPLGLDGGYPYPPRFFSLTGPNTAEDSPGIVLDNGVGETGETFDAIMYVMWDPAIPPANLQTCTTAHVDQTFTPYHFIPSTCASIPVPLASIEWKWSGCAINNGAGANPNWSVQCGAAKALTPVAAFPGFPEWSHCDISHFGGC